MKPTTQALLMDCRARLAILGEEISRALKEVDHALAVSGGAISPAPKVSRLRLPNGKEIPVRKTASRSAKL